MLFQPTTWPLPVIAAAFVLAAVLITLFGVRLARLADRLADATGLGEALMGAVFLGGATSLPGITTSVIAAADGHAELAISNALGGIAVQTAFLAIADMTLRRVNLEHAASSLTNLLQGSLLVALLSAPLLAMAGPEIAWFGVHPVSVLLLVAYWSGVRLASKARHQPMWNPCVTPETRLDPAGPTRLSRRNLAGLWLGFAFVGGIVAFAGFVVARAGIELSARTGISEAIVGGLFTAICTSLPELVTSIAAVRQGALTLAVGGIIGGNCFDVLFISFADFAYREGSIYHALADDQIFMIALTLLLTGILLLGLLRREKHGIANIGFESFLILIIYLGAFLLLSFQG